MMASAGGVHTAGYCCVQYVIYSVYDNTAVRVQYILYSVLYIAKRFIAGRTPAEPLGAVRTFRGKREEKKL